MKAVRPDPSVSAGEMIFGADLTLCTRESIEKLLALPPSVIEALILPPDLRTPDNPFSERIRYDWERLDGGDILPAELTRQFTALEAKRLSQFSRSAELAIRDAADAGYTSLLFDGAWNGYFTMTDDCLVPEPVLKQLLPVTMETGLQLILPFEVHTQGGPVADRMKKLLNRVGGPGFRVRLDIRFPQAGKTCPCPADAGLLLQETECVRFILNNDDGIDPNPALLNEWITDLAWHGFHGGFYFQFVGSGAEDAAPAALKAAEMVRKLRSSRI